MATGKSGGKGNSKKRRMNAALQARRAISWRRGQARKKARQEAQAAREAANKLRRDAGVPTPWEVAQQAAQRRREGREQ